MIWKLLLIVGLIALVYFLFIKKKPLSHKESEKKDAPKSSDMVECASCGIYCALDEAIVSNGKYYCSKECLEKAK